MHKKIRFAFHWFGGEDWIAGTIYLRTIFCALREEYHDTIKLFLCVPEDYSWKAHFNHIEPDGIIFIPSLGGILSKISKISKYLLCRDLIIENKLKKEKINILFGNILQYKYPRAITLSLLPDFQHVHLPYMFTRKERFIRDKLFMRSCMLSDKIILFSNTVKEDFKSFAPEYLFKARVLHPASYIPQSVYTGNINPIMSLYNIPEKFFYLPNQFWKHKNHEIVFRAVEILKKQGILISVVCSGRAFDNKDPGHFVKLWQKVKQWGIEKQIYYTGLIRYELVLSIMRQSICVINPSLFEGWGCTVNEANCLGKTLLLSNIPSHIEQCPMQAIFFDPHNSNELAEKMNRIWFNCKSGPNLEIESKMRSNAANRLQQFAKDFLRIAS